MNILIISGSPRKGGNTELLVDAFAKGAAAHHHVEIVSVRDYKVNPCLGCNACANERYESLLSDGRMQPSVAEGNACFKTNGVCAQKDDMTILYEKMSQADMLVIASPVYFYGISAQLKAVIDRFHNPIRDTFHIKKMALLLVGAATLPELFDAILTEYNLCLRVFAPKFGYLEDPATGSGNSAFANYLLSEGLWKGEPIMIEQGGNNRIFNSVKLKCQDGKVLFGGKATKKIEGEYYI